MADPLVPLWLIAAACAVGGIVAGIVFERMTGSAAKRAAKFEADLVQVRAELMQYREDTARHFGKSAELLGRMATDYREFLHHFVSGAEDLCSGTMKEIKASGFERPLLETARPTAQAPAAPPDDLTFPADSEPLAEDLPHELHGLAGASPTAPLDRPR